MRKMTRSHRDNICEFYMLTYLIRRYHVQPFFIVVLEKSEVQDSGETRDQVSRIERIRKQLQSARDSHFVLVLPRNIWRNRENAVPRNASLGCINVFNRKVLALGLVFLLLLAFTTARTEVRPTAHQEQNHPH